MVENDFKISPHSLIQTTQGFSALVPKESPKGTTNEPILLSAFLTDVKRQLAEGFINWENEHVYLSAGDDLHSDEDY